MVYILILHQYEQNLYYFLNYDNTSTQEHLTYSKSIDDDLKNLLENGCENTLSLATHNKIHCSQMPKHDTCDDVKLGTKDKAKYSFLSIVSNNAKCDCNVKCSKPG